MLGEDPVVFRDTDGRVGVMDEILPASPRVAGVRPQRELRPALPLSRLEDGRRRQRDRNGVGARASVMSQRSSTPPTRCRNGAASSGVLWSAATMPRVPAAQLAPVADARVTVAKVILPCNWAQILKVRSTRHSSSLHSSDMVPARVDGAKATDSLWLRPSTDKAPRLQVERTVTVSLLRRNPAPHRQRERERLCRQTVFVAPATALIPPK